MIVVSDTFVSREGYYTHQEFVVAAHWPAEVAARVFAIVLLAALPLIRRRGKRAVGSSEDNA